MADDIEVTLHYRGDPVIRPDIEKTLGVSLKLNDKKIKADIKLIGPEDWKIQISNESLGQTCFIILASKVEDYNTLTINFSRNDQYYSTSFTILGPNEAQGYPSGAQIPKSYFKGSDKEWLQRIGLSKKQ